ncbi:unnamed protein product [Rhizophagus irregularis]|nr:unnamed protein product [Rhizophagus irregularis]
MIVSIPADYDLLYIVYHFRPLIQLSLLFILITFFSWYFQLIIMEVLPIISSSKHIMIKLKAQTIPQRQIDFINNHPDENIFRFDDIIRNLWPISPTTLNEKTIIHYDDLYQSHLSWITSSQQTGDPRLCWEVQVTYDLRGDNDNFSCSLEKKIGTKKQENPTWIAVAKLVRVIAVKILGKERRGAWSDQQEIILEKIHVILQSSPASTQEVITTGATGIDDLIPIFSNSGLCVETYLPQVQVWFRHM